MCFRNGRIRQTARIRFPLTYPFNVNRNRLRLRFALAFPIIRNRLGVFNFEIIRVFRAKIVFEVFLGPYGSPLLEIVTKAVSHICYYYFED